MSTRSLVELTGEVSLSNAIPTEGFADLVIESSLAAGELSGVITTLDFDQTAGNGKSVIVRYWPSRVAQTIQSGQCLSSTSSTMQKATITIAQYGDYDTLDAFSLWEAKPPVKLGLLNEMGKGLAAKRDSLIASALNTAKLYTQTLTLATGNSTLTTHYSGNDYYSKPSVLYHSIVSAAAWLKHRGANWDDLVCICNPTVGKYLLHRDSLTTPIAGNLVTWNGKNVMSVAGIPVVMSAALNTVNATSKSTMAYVIDTKRGIAEAWGQRPIFEEERIPYCNTYRETVWMFYGCSVVSKGAIIAIRNP